MDFILALTHFCEKHGPKSVLCTQVLPLDCTICAPPHQRRDRKGSFESYTTQVGRDDEQLSNQSGIHLRRQTDSALPPVRSHASVALELSSANSKIEDHPYFRPQSSQGFKFPYNQQHTEICASCSYTIPTQVAAKLPEGAPGSLTKDGSRNPNSVPVLRSREFVCLGSKRRKSVRADPGSSQDTHESSATSCSSTTSHANCHDHTLTYLTSKSPYDAEVFATLRNSVVRALSGEQLPHGMSEGPFCFGDSTSGYTIAYSFRLTDPKARGRVRRYAFVALAGRDAYRAFKACPMLWEAFALMSKTIEQAAQRYQDAQEQAQLRERDEQLARDAKAGYSNISSFLTQRPRDPDGQPRRVGQTLPMDLAEIIGDENIFAVLHQYFVHVLRCLGDKFGGVPISDEKRMVYHSAPGDQENEDLDVSAKSSTDMLADMSIHDRTSEPNGTRRGPMQDSGSLSGSRFHKPDSAAGNPERAKMSGLGPGELPRRAHQHP